MRVFYQPTIQVISGVWQFRNFEVEKKTESGKLRPVMISHIQGLNMKKQRHI